MDKTQKDKILKDIAQRVEGVEYIGSGRFIATGLGRSKESRAFAVTARNEAGDMVREAMPERKLLKTKYAKCAVWKAREFESDHSWSCYRCGFHLELTDSEKSRQLMGLGW